MPPVIEITYFCKLSGRLGCVLYEIRTFYLNLFIVIKRQPEFALIVFKFCSCKVVLKKRVDVSKAFFALFVEVLLVLSIS